MNVCVETNDKKKMIEEMRLQLSAAVAEAKGDLGAFEVYALSRQLDQMIIEYMAKGKGQLD